MLDRTAVVPPGYFQLTQRPCTRGSKCSTCCNDTDYDGGLNRYASDRVMVAGDLEIDALEGGSVAPGGPLPDDLSYTCHAAEEHAPIRAHISTK